ncbi:alpha-ribazole phosphatase [Paenibacillus baekrokdamisoli]|uniref:Alpha-ribazole phosphatase n=1 Tax=Paenibacillus baekrokdamisoli TaxID=1712516 RepID=A0A3G9JHS9_9BACL|nr:histidine phosphatase family protein [Paenibacillus baekrokdamisoli]MBB3068776.1 alpha-ribazole phosphatase [Paenibacillus baekrokdamisoli]BBH23608.1 alpha-ribazole phosphatase [Paenibacillus baekrokdamisoli]
MTTIYLLRHGETEWNAAGNRYCGITDIPLSETGRSQARKAAAWFQDIPLSAVYCSPLKRALETAQTIARSHSLAASSDPRLQEIDFGQWEGRTKQQILQEDPSVWERWLVDPADTQAGQCGETAAAVCSRVLSCINELSKKHEGESLLIVGHNTVNRLFMADSLGMPLSHYRKLEQYNTGINVLKYTEGSYRLIHWNMASHLEGE